MRLGRLLPLLVGVLTLGACATPWQVADVQDIETMAATGGTAFTKALLEEYRQQSHNESIVEQDWLHAVMFARKGERAAGGEVVLPEDLAAWDLPDAVVPPLADARAKLVADLDAGARDRLPELAAKAQANFDCWVEEESEGDPDPTCKDIVLAALPQLAPPPPPVAAAAPLKVVKTFVIYFDYDKADIGDAARKVLAEVIAAQATVKPMVISVSGYTDTMGTKTYNQKLSDRRARSVADALAGLGVNARLNPVGFGKTHLAVKTANHVREAKNRRVEIYFESPAESAVPGSSSLLRSDGDRLSQAPAAAAHDVATTVAAAAPPAAPSPATTAAVAPAAHADLTALTTATAARPAPRAGPENPA